MAGRTERCRRCRTQLLVPPNAPDSVRCGVCLAVTLVRPPRDPVGRVHERVRWAKNWVKGLAGPVSRQRASFAAVAAPHSLRPEPSFPSVHGARKALLVGISYRSMRYELEGCVNDVNCMKYLLQNKYGFPEQCILLLTEEEADPCRIPTRQNMLAAMRWLVHGCRAGDSLVFHFAGHGSQQIDTDGDEADGYDETLCPMDFEVNGMITDDEVHATMVEPLPYGVRLHAVVDACHSGTSLDLPYVCRMARGGYWQWEDILNNKRTRGGHAICFSACDDHQTSSDTSAFTRDVMTGAMTYCFIHTVEIEPEVTYGRMLHTMRAAIRGANTFVRIDGPIASLLRKVFRKGLTQVPQLSSSDKFNVFQTPFTL